MNRVIKKHGSEIAAGLAGGIASTLATLANTDAPGSKGTKSNLSRLSERVVDTLTGRTGKKARKQGLSDRSSGTTRRITNSYELKQKGEETALTIVDVTA